MSRLRYCVALQCFSHGNKLIPRMKKIEKMSEGKSEPWTEDRKNAATENIRE